MSYLDLVLEMGVDLVPPRESPFQSSPVWRGILDSVLDVDLMFVDNTEGRKSSVCVRVGICASMEMCVSVIDR